MNSNLCAICKKPKGRNKYTCSRACHSIYKKNRKKCVVCQNEFYAPPSSDKVTCSAKCSKAHRQTLYEQGVNEKALKLAHEVIKIHPLTGRFETHINAKKWVIKSPTGNIYHCRNLKNWLRQHKDLLDGTPQQAWDGITKIKYSVQGKRKNPSYQWKGWTLIEFEE